MHTYIHIYIYIYIYTLVVCTAALVLNTVAVGLEVEGQHLRAVTPHLPTKIIPTSYNKVGAIVVVVVIIVIVVVVVVVVIVIVHAVPFSASMLYCWVVLYYSMLYYIIV